MSTSSRLPPPEKNTSSWVRPGVCEVRASALRPVSALIRLDLPTFERPANAISMPFIFGSDDTEPAADRNCQLDANSFRPASISGLLKVGSVMRNAACLNVGTVAPCFRSSRYMALGHELRKQRGTKAVSDEFAPAS